MLLFAGTLAAGAAIAVANVLLPALVKRRFGAQATFVTGIYSVALGVGAALAAGLAVPSEGWLGDSWRARARGVGGAGAAGGARVAAAAAAAAQPRRRRRAACA